MKTSQDIFNEHVLKQGHTDPIQVILNAMVEYAREVAQEALKNAAERLESKKRALGINELHEIEMEAVSIVITDPKNIPL